MKVGDFVCFERIPHPYAESETRYGIVIQLSRTGKNTKSAQVLSATGEFTWIETERLEVVSGS